MIGPFIISVLALLLLLRISSFFIRVWLTTSAFDGQGIPLGTRLIYRLGRQLIFVKRRQN